MLNVQELNKVKELLAGGQTEPAADLLLKLAKEADPEHYNTALLLKNRVETLQHRVIEGVLSQSEERVEWARVSKGIVELVDQIVKGEKPVREDSIKTTKPKTTYSKTLLWAVPLLLLGVFFIPKIFKGIASEPIKTEKTINPKMLEVKGTLMLPNKKAVPNASIILASTNEGILPSNKIEFRTDANGRYQFKVPETLRGKQVSIVIKRGDKESKPRLIKFYEKSFEVLTVEN